MPSKLKSTFERAQTYLRQHRIDGWLLHDFQGNNPILWQLYGSQPHTTRRVDLLIPAQGEVRLLVSAVDAGQFRDFPGHVVPYLDAQQYRSQLAASLKDVRSVAMEYSAGSSLPVVSRVDAGTIELVRGMGVEVVSSADLVQYTVALWTPRPGGRPQTGRNRRPRGRRGRLPHRRPTRRPGRRVRRRTGHRR